MVEYDHRNANSFCHHPVARPRLKANPLASLTSRKFISQNLVGFRVRKMFWNDHVDHIEGVHTAGAYFWALI